MTTHDDATPDDRENVSEAQNGNAVSDPTDPDVIAEGDPAERVETVDRPLPPEDDSDEQASNRQPERDVRDAHPGCDTPEMPSAGRSAAERDEWLAAGRVGTGLDRARTALALAARRVEHAAAEGIAYV